jgi:hypothetical protein
VRSINAPRGVLMAAGAAAQACSGPHTLASSRRCRTRRAGQQPLAAQRCRSSRVAAAAGRINWQQQALQCCRRTSCRSRC